MKSDHDGNPKMIRVEDLEMGHLKPVTLTPEDLKRGEAIWLRFESGLPEKDRAFLFQLSREDFAIARGWILALITYRDAFSSEPIGSPTIEMIQSGCPGLMDQAFGFKMTPEERSGA